MLSISKSCLLLLVSSLVFAKSTPKKSASPIINGTAVSSTSTFPYQVLTDGSNLIEIQDEKSHKIVKSSNVKAIKDREKNNPKAYSRVDFEVADLPRGTYYVQVTFDQRSEKDKTAYRIILTD